MTRGLMRAAADYDSSGGNDAQPASRRSAARMSIPARQELICNPVSNVPACHLHNSRG